MSTYEFNGKSTTIGDKVLYTANDGRKHELTIKNLNQSYAELEGEIDGSTQTFTSVPYHISGTANTWDHIADIPVEAPVPQESAPSGPEEPGQPATFE